MSGTTRRQSDNQGKLAFPPAAVLAVLLTWPVLLLLDTGVALARGWQARSSFPGALGALCGAAILGTVALAASAGGRRLLARQGAAMVVVVASLSFGGVAGESLCLLTGACGGRDSHLRPANIYRVFRPNPRWMLGIQDPSRYTTNALGIRGSALPAGGVKVLCVGGSTTECIYLDDAETWPYLLGETLSGAGQNVWVGNAGISGYSTVEHLDFLHRSQVLESVDTVILLIGINDFIRSLNGSLESGPRPLWRRTVLAGALLNLHRQAFLREVFRLGVEDNGGANLRMRRRARQRGEWVGDLPPLDRGLREYQERIVSLVKVCRRRELRCVFLTQPTLWRKDLGPQARASLWMGWDERGRYFDPGKLRQGLDRYNATLLNACAGLDLECVDLGPLSGQEDLFYDDCHFTEIGSRVVARMLGDYLLAHPDSRR